MGAAQAGLQGSSCRAGLWLCWLKTLTLKAAAAVRQCAAPAHNVTARLGGAALLAESCTQEGSHSLHQLQVSPSPELRLLVGPGLQGLLGDAGTTFSESGRAVVRPGGFCRGVLCVALRGRAPAEALLRASQALLPQRCN